jgi:hypothetical protein
VAEHDGGYGGGVGRDFGSDRDLELEHGDGASGGCAFEEEADCELAEADLFRCGKWDGFLSLGFAGNFTLLVVSVVITFMYILLHIYFLEADVCDLSRAMRRIVAICGSMGSVLRRRRGCLRTRIM